MENIIDSAYLNANSTSTELKSLTPEEQTPYLTMSSLLISCLIDLSQFTDYPEDLKLSTVYTTENIYSNLGTENITNEKIGDYSYTKEKAETLIPNSAKLILEKYSNRVGSFSVFTKKI